MRLSRSAKPSTLTRAGLRRIRAGAFIQPELCLRFLPVVIVPILFIASCAGPARSTALTMGDLEATTAAMAAKLSASPLLAERNAHSPRMVIAISKVENLSSDLIPEGEQWWLMAK